MIESTIGQGKESDLISRRAAIEAVKREQSLIERPITETRWFDLGLRKAQDVLRELPSAQPTQTNTPNALKSLGCISRQAAIDAVRSYMEDSEIDDSDRHADGIAYDIKRLPTAEPKTGRWINANEGKWNTVEVLKCTACGEMDNRMYRTDSYCPNCGARMEGEDNAT